MVERHPWPERQDLAGYDRAGYDLAGHDLAGYNRADEEKVIPWAEGNGLWAAITRLTSDLSAVDVVTFFVQNPYAADTAQSIAERIGRHLEVVAPILESLTDAGFFDRLDLEGIVIYQMTSDPHRRQTLQQYVTWLQEAYHWARLIMAD